MTPEEIYERRRQHFENVASGAQLIQKMFGNGRSVDSNTFQELLKEYQDMYPAYCEHEKPMVESCMACDEIFKQCFPENCYPCSQCKEIYLDEDELDDDICDTCRYGSR